MPLSAARIVTETCLCECSTMSGQRVTVNDDWSYRGIRSVALENEFVRVLVFPELGAKIYDLIYKPSQKNVLWHNPQVKPTKVPLGAAFDDVWCGGWDEIFPNDAPCNVNGEHYPDMGEAWSTAWSYSIIRLDDRSETATLVTSVMTPITPCRITRSLTLRAGEPKIHLRYLLENVGQDALKFLWKIHPAFQINETCSIEIPAKTGIVDPRYTHLYSQSSHRYHWPNAQTKGGERIDLSKVPPPTSHTCALHYVTDLEDGAVKLMNSQDNVDVKISFPKQILNNVWLFLAYGGYRSLYTAVIEPSTSYPYDLGQAIGEGRTSHLIPRQSLTCNIDVELSPHSSAI